MEENEKVGLQYRLALLLVCLLLLGLIAALPIAFGNVFGTMIRPSAGQIYSIATPAAPSPTEYADIRVAMIALDELAGFVTLRVTGYYTCQPPCTSTDRIAFASIDPAEEQADRMPRVAAVVLSPTAPEIAQTIQLPVHGHALRYPFDNYELLLGINLQRVGADGAAQPLTAAEAANHLRLSIREALPIFEMSAPQAIDPTTVRTVGQPYDFLYVESIYFRRPVEVQITTVVMVVLAGAVATFAVFMQPLRDLLVGTGGLILALWGIRGLLVPSNINYPTVADVGLGLVMGFLLTAISVRGLAYLWERNRLQVPRLRLPRAPTPGAKPPTGSTASAEE